MKTFYKSIILGFFIMQLISCINSVPKTISNNLKLIPKTYNELEKVDHRIRIDSLLKSNRGRSFLITQMGDVNNLDKIYGFRGLRFNMPFESINFLTSKIDTNEYYNKIITVNFSADLNIIGNDNYDNLSLVFFNKKLTSIKIYQSFNLKQDQGKNNPDIIVNDIIDNSNRHINLIYTLNDFPINDTYSLLISLYGKPNMNFDGFLNTHIGRGLRSSIPEGAYIDEKSGSWKSKYLVLTYNGKYYCDRLGPSAIIFLNYLAVSIEYTLIEDKIIINERIKSISDSLKKERENQNNIDLIKKF